MHHNSDNENVTCDVTHKPVPLLASYCLSVAGAYRVERLTLDHRKVRVVVPDWKVPQRSDCWPVFESHLAEDFARITDEASLRDFADRNGLLGYHRVHEAEMRRRNENWQGDPVPWALAHARLAAGILGATDIINDVRRGKQDLNDHSVGYLIRALLSEFEKMGLEPLFAAGPPRRWEGFTWTPPEALVSRTKFQLQKRFSGNWKNDPIGTSYYVLSWILNQYIRSVRFEFVSLDYAGRCLGLTESEPRFGPELCWDALLQVIYWQLAESIGGAFRQCQRCGRVFPMRTGKDKFCTRRCSDALRSKRYRAEKKQRQRRPRKR